MNSNFTYKPLVLSLTACLYMTFQSHSQFGKYNGPEFEGPGYRYRVALWGYIDILDVCMQADIGISMHVRGRLWICADAAETSMRVQVAEETALLRRRGTIPLLHPPPPRQGRHRQ